MRCPASRVRVIRRGDIHETSSENQVPVLLGSDWPGGEGVHRGCGALYGGAGGARVWQEIAGKASVAQAHLAVSDR